MTNDELNFLEMAHNEAKEIMLSGEPAFIYYLKGSYIVSTTSPCTMVERFVCDQRPRPLLIGECRPRK